MRGLPDFTRDVLTEAGVLVEELPQGALEILLPDDVAKTVELPEHTQLRFPPSTPYETEPIESTGSNGGPDSVLVSYDSDLFKNMARLLGDRGRFSSLHLPPFEARLEKLEDKLSERILLNNAVFHVEKKEYAPVSYLFAYFKYTAVSDERQEGILGAVINEFNLSVRQVEADLPPVLQDAESGPLTGAQRQEMDSVLKALCRAQVEIVSEKLQNFIKSLERRLARDIQRVWDYYQTLIRETRQFLEKKTSSVKEDENYLSKIAAIETELKWKIQDLVAKYSLSSQIEPVCFVRVDVVAPIFWLTIKRRKGVRSLPVAYNPILKGLDPLPCESCFRPQNAWSVCDDQLHIVCPRCFPVCNDCGKEYCSACHVDGCPKCVREK